ncbi:hypothetical protein Q31b_31930 [Novipirellula aureliae]|uniref:Uncharacterized protein n=1 Tax=Novipirellula aureliae TaxID=2527966 RepID=A0A5C6DSZ4_9BACT|nr:hypothetical protein [Novipirellula aureliae]TWU39878.1 hypothetical protein Q31b_31930 [Novipirellula aureliae]
MPASVVAVSSDAAIMSKMADELQTESVQSLVLTTEGSHHRALKAVDRIGFQNVAQASLFQLGPICRATCPTLSETSGFKLGRYVGDKH